MTSKKIVIGAGVACIFGLAVSGRSLMGAADRLKEADKAGRVESVVTQSAKPTQISSTCEPLSFPDTQEALQSLEANFEPRVRHEIGSETFEIWSNRNSESPDQTVVVARYQDGRVCFTPALEK
jgi:hypothetical protein